MRPVPREVGRTTYTTPDGSFDYGITRVRARPYRQTVRRACVVLFTGRNRRALRSVRNTIDYLCNMSTTFVIFDRHSIRPVCRIKRFGISDDTLGTDEERMKNTNAPGLNNCSCGSAELSCGRFEESRYDPLTY